MVPLLAGAFNQSCSSNVRLSSANKSIVSLPHSFSTFRENAEECYSSFEVEETVCHAGFCEIKLALTECISINDQIIAQACLHAFPEGANWKQEAFGEETINAFIACEESWRCAAAVTIFNIFEGLFALGWLLAMASCCTTLWRAWVALLCNGDGTRSTNLNYYRTNYVPDTIPNEEARAVLALRM
jgi:hypothetical protein